MPSSMPYKYTCGDQPVKSASTTFLFVNKDAKSSSLSKSKGAARFEIFRHAKLRAYEQKKTSGHRQKSARDIQSGVLPFDDDHDDVETDPDRHRNKAVVELLSAQRDKGQFQQSNTSPVRYAGCSDPFGAQEVIITARVNQLISYARDLYFPANYMSTYMRSMTKDCPKNPSANAQIVLGGLSYLRDWNQFKNGLSTELAGLAWLFDRVPPMVAIREPAEAQEMSVMALKMRSKSIQVLRDRMATRDVQKMEKPTVFLHMLWLFRADCVEGNIPSAKVHAKALCELFGRPEDPVPHIPFLINMMFNDTDLTVRFMQRTMFDLEEWVLERLTLFWAITEKMLPIVSPEYEELHECIRNPSIRGPAIRLRRCLAIAKTPIKLDSPESIRHGDIIFQWMATQTLYDLGTLSNVHLDLMEDKRGPMSEGLRFTEAALAFAVTFVHRKSMHTADVDGVDFRDYSLIIIPRMRKSLELALATSTPEELLEFQKAYLWMFYIGAQYEHRKGIDKTPQRWYTDKFGEHVRHLGLKTWIGVETVLQKFVHSDYLKPDLVWWFDTAATVTPQLANLSQLVIRTPQLRSEMIAA